MSTNGKQGYRLSPQQRHVWQLQTRHPGSYVTHGAVAIEGELDVSRLKRAVSDVVSRHEILRTRFERRVGMQLPVQVIEEDAAFGWREMTLPSSSGSAWKEWLAGAMVSDLESWDFNQSAHPVNVTVVQCKPQRAGLIVTISGACGDAVSWVEMVKQIIEAYTLAASGSDQQEEPLQYADVAELFNEMLESEEAEQEQEFWRAPLAAVDPTERLPFETGDAGTFRPGYVDCTIDREMASKCIAFADEHQASPAAFFLALWQILLWRLTGVAERCIGTVFSGRQHEDLRDTLGLFARTLPVVCACRGDERLTEVLSRVDDSLHISETRQEYFSWDQPPNLIHPPESLPFIPAGFEYNEWTSRLFRGAGPATFSLVGEVACLDRFKLKLSVQRCENDLKATILFDSSFISAQNVQRIARYFCTLAQNAISRSGAPIYDLDFLEEEEAKYLIHALNQTKSDYERDICIHELFERQSEQFPDRVAVVGESERLTYRDLNRRANQLAHRLRRMGVGPESKVALCAERSVGFIVGLLGVLKAGGAYIPMDLQTPAARLAYMIKDAGAGIVLTQRAFRALFEGQGRSVICLDSPEEGLEEESAQNPGLQVAPANLAYLIYTSGSTGEPKAVAVEHRQIANYLQSVVQRLELPSGASYALVSTVAADLGNTSIFPALCYGGCLHVISQSIAADPECLAEYFRRHQPDCLKIAPSHLTAMLCASGPADVLPKRRLIFGGEASSWAMADRIKALAPALRIFNHYGPTETTVGVLTNPVNPSAAKRWTAQVPLGRPISNTQVYILDAWLRPAPMGISGEVFIGGENVSRGYLNRPDASAERFIPDPFAVAPGSRMYRTGDLARYLPDGTLEFLGRSDHQIKIRGHRVELREVEAALLHHQAVREAVVVANQDAADEGRLVAYWIGRPNLSATVAELREALRQRMPEYMVPSFFVKLDAWPLNPNGKIDRKALPRPNLQASDPDKGYVAPRSDAEKTIARIWRDVLRVERVGLYNNFFDLGGHSLLMVQVHSKLRETFSREISMMDMFKYTTVGTLAGYLSVGQTDPTSHIYGETRAQIRQAALQQRGEYRETR